MQTTISTIATIEPAAIAGRIVRRDALNALPASAWPPITVHPLSAGQRAEHLLIGSAKLDELIADEDARLEDLRALRRLVDRAFAGEPVLEDPAIAATWQATCGMIDDFYAAYDSDDEPGAERLLGAVAGTRVYLTGGSMVVFGDDPYPFHRATFDEEIAENGLAEGSPLPPPLFCGPEGA